MLESMHQRTKVLEFCCEIIENCCNKKGWNPGYVVAISLDNAPPFVAASTWAPLDPFNWELFDHPSDSHDLAPTDNPPFCYLKSG